MGYTEILGDVIPSARGAGRAADIVAALTPPPPAVPGVSPAVTPAAPPASTSQLSFTQATKAFAPGLVGGVAGAVLWKKHRVLGLLLGHAVGANATALSHGGDRTRALCQLAVEGSGVAGALYYKRNPVVGWLLGVVAGAAVTSFVQGSPAHDWKSGKFRGTVNP